MKIIIPDSPVQKQKRWFLTFLALLLHPRSLNLQSPPIYHLQNYQCYLVKD